MTMFGSLFRSRSRHLLALSLPALLSCSAVQVSHQALPVQKVGQSAPFNTEVAVSVGDVMFSEFNYLAQSRAVTKAAFEWSKLLAKVNLPTGSKLIGAEVGGLPAYCTIEPAYFVPGESRSVCFFDANSDQVFEKFYVVGTLESFTYDASLPYAIRDEPINSEGFKYELLYQGYDQGVVRISYREFKNDMARQAFQQDVSYTMNESGATDISFKKVSMRIISADNSRIRFVVLGGFGESN